MYILRVNVSSVPCHVSPITLKQAIHSSLSLLDPIDKTLLRFKMMESTIFIFHNN